MQRLCNTTRAGVCLAASVRRQRRRCSCCARIRRFPVQILKLEPCMLQRPKTVKNRPPLMAPAVFPSLLRSKMSKRPRRRQNNSIVRHIWLQPHLAGLPCTPNACQQSCAPQQRERFQHSVIVSCRGCATIRISESYWRAKKAFRSRCLCVAACAPFAPRYMTDDVSN